MSRIGRLPVALPTGVKVDIKQSAVEGSTVEVTGPNGTLSRTFHPDIDVQMTDDQIVVSRPSDGRQHKALHGLTRALINNMVIGVNEGFSKVLEIVGVGYRASLRGDNLVLQLGHMKAADTMSHVAVSMAKRNNVWMAQECARLAREIHGANGIVNEYPVMRHLMNMETVHTYEGTHDIHTLVLGQYLTGISAFEPPPVR